MPRSPLRRKRAFVPPPTSKAAVHVGSPRWLVPLMVALFVVGLAWIVVYYISRADYPVPGIGNGNMAIGFGLILAGFIASTRWK